MSRVIVLGWLAAFAFAACVHDWNPVTRDGADALAQTDAASDLPCTTCPGGCYTLENDPSNCGTCGNVCVPPDHAMARCSAGVCDFTCSTGYDRCGDRCWDTQVSVNFCGQACVDCAALPHVNQDTVGCSHGNCALSTGCAANYADCDGVASNGCEADLTSANTCGSCSQHCAGVMPRCVADAVSGNYMCSI